MIQTSSYAEKGIALGSTEGEYVTLSDAVIVVSGVRWMMSELMITQCATKIFQDNQGSRELSTAGNAKQFLRRNLVDIHYNFVTNKVENGNVNLVKITTDMMKADLFTKPLCSTQFNSALAQSSIFG